MKEGHGLIRIFALVCVGVTSAYVMYMGFWHTELLAASNWCNRAIGAADKGDKPEFAVSGCFSLLKDQVSALAWDSHINNAVIALCLLALMVIVVAGGKISFAASRDGVSGNIGGAADAPSTPAEGARQAAEAAVTEADKIVSQTEGRE
jgi:hypothetical protein